MDADGSIVSKSARVGWGVVWGTYSGKFESEAMGIWSFLELEAETKERVETRRNETSGFEKRILNGGWADARWSNAKLSQAFVTSCDQSVLQLKASSVNGPSLTSISYELCTF